MVAENKKITLEDLALIVKESEKRIIEVVDTKIDELAVTTKHGFDSVGGQLEEIKNSLDDLDKSNSQAHENTTLRLNEVAYSFELVALKKRVEVLEKKAEMRA